MDKEAKYGFNTKSYLEYCQEMRMFLLQRVKLHLRYITVLYILGLPLIFLSTWWILADGSISWPEVTVIALIATNLYLLVRFHITRYSTSVIERSKWHRYYESVLRLQMLAEFQQEHSDISTSLISQAVNGLFPEFDESRKLAIDHSNQDGINSAISKYIKDIFKPTSP